MKQIHLQTQIKTPSITSPLCNKAAFLLIFAFVMQSITLTLSFHSVGYPGNKTNHVALLAIKSQLKLPSNRVLSSWNDSIHYCSWEGVTCGRKHKRVVVLDLSSRELAGTISPFIGNLSFLKIINLYNNSLYGEIPTQLGHLARLHELRLFNNTFVGVIPANISRCANLRVIHLANNKLEGRLPTGIGALSKLTDFRVQSNNLTGALFDIIQNLTSLVIISTSNNSFTGTIPNNFGRMQNLTYLSVGENELSGTLPTSLFNISSLQIMNFMENHLHGELPANVGVNIPRLTWLILLENRFTGLIPITIQNLTALEMIELGFNNLIGNVPYFGNFHKLTYLSLGGNFLEGDINFIDTLVNCSQLRVLNLGLNRFSGILPKSVANLSTTLEWLVIQNTSTRGNIPEGITNLINLEHLSMDNCKLMGSLPRDFGNLHKLEELYLPSNRLEGKIPSSLGNLSYLNELHLGNNKLEGSIPPNLGNLQHLQVLYLHSNRLEGKIPSSLGNLSYMSELDLNNNKLEGSIPPNLGNCQSLLYMHLSNNELNGTLDIELFQGYASFLELDLSYNHLEGSLPLEFSKQSNLEFLELSNNKFSGVIPNGLGNCSSLQYLSMEGNSLHGNIPSSLASLNSLQQIDFSGNSLSGPIPAFFSRFPKLVFLDLSYNDFEGRVPTNSIFAIVGAVDITGNSRLCGGIKQLQLPECVENGSMERKNKTILKLIIGIISGIAVVLAMAIGLYLTCIKKKKKPLLSGLVMKNVTTKVSYNMLLKATTGFSSENLLGTGSFGSVFKGILDGNTIAVKVLNFQYHGASKSFIAECNTLRNVRHRNLVGIITVCSSIDFQRNDFRALVYKFMPNRSLDKWLYGAYGNINLAQRLDIAIDVAHALAYLHHECETPIVHCNLKPSNILLDNDMVAHVGDFGLARILIQPPHVNQSSTIGIRGTIGYAAPEYGLGSKPSTKGDVYSYGIVLLELITGKSPTDDMFKEGYSLHMHAETALPNQVLQIVDPSLEEDNHTDDTLPSRAIQDERQRRVECIISMISVGVSCSNHLPQERMKIVDARSRLQSARDNLLNVRKRRYLPAGAISLDISYVSQ